jgi:hypothetical protein
LLGEALVALHEQVSFTPSQGYRYCVTDQPASGDTIKQADGTDDADARAMYKAIYNANQRAAQEIES